MSSKYTGSKEKEGIIPARIREARISRGYTLSELSELIGVSIQAISQYEIGSSRPQPEILMKLMNVLGFPLSFFRKPKGNLNPNIPNSAVYFRSMKSTSSKIKEAYKYRIEWVNEIYEYISKYVEFPKIDLPSVSDLLKENDLDNETIENIAIFLRKYWGLDKSPIQNMTELLEEKGFVICRIEFSNRKIDAFSQWFNKIPYIVLGNESSAVRWRFDLAHELGHLILHQYIDQEDIKNKEVLDRIEDEANYFAGAFLMPIGRFDKEIFSSSINQLILLKKKWKVSMSAMIKRAQSLNLLTENQIRYLNSQMTSNMYWRKEPLDKEIEFEKPYLLKQAMELLIDNEVINPDDLLDEIALTKTEVDSLCFLPEKLLQRKARTNLQLKSFVD